MTGSWIGGLELRVCKMRDPAFPFFIIFVKLFAISKEITSGHIKIASWVIFITSSPSGSSAITAIIALASKTISIPKIGYVSLRNTRTGTWFIQTLCQILNEHYTELTLDEMVMLVQQEVAKKEYQIKQMVRYESTLLKKLKFV